MVRDQRKPGAVAFLENPRKFSTQITEQHYDMLMSYCRKHRVSMAEATRRAIEQLTGGETDPTDNLDRGIIRAPDFERPVES